MANNHNNNHYSHNHQSGHNNHRDRDHKDREHREHKNHHGNSNKDNQVINTFVLGTKELDDKNAEFQYDKGWYSITDIVGEERTVIYKSKNTQEAYTKWNVYIGRKKERGQKVEKPEKSE